MIEFATLQIDDVIVNIEVLDNGQQCFPIGTSFTVVMAREEFLRVRVSERSTIRTPHIVTMRPSIANKLKLIETKQNTDGVPFQTY